jgi:hypothetical protein
LLSILNSPSDPFTQPYSDCWSVQCACSSSDRVSHVRQDAREKW